MPTFDEMHPEDVKAAIRKVYGSVLRFQREHRLPEYAVRDAFRGHRSRRVERVINEFLASQAVSADASAIPADPVSVPMSGRAGQVIIDEFAFSDVPPPRSPRDGMTAFDRIAVLVLLSICPAFWGLLLWWLS